MKVICLTHKGAKHYVFNLDLFKHVLLPMGLGLFLLLGLSFNKLLGLHPLQQTPPSFAFSTDQMQSVLSALGQQINAVDAIQQTHANYTVDVDTLSLRLGVLEAEIVRLNALAQRVIQRARLDPNEFALDKKPPRGGIDEYYQAASSPMISSQELLSGFATAEINVQRQLSVLQSLYDLVEGLALEGEVMPSFSPVKKGYISSAFGFRRDPFNGRLRSHNGIDFAGPVGTAIYAVGAGVVSFADWRGGYGKVIEIDHGQGLVSRYAHLSKFNVEAGSVVNKGSLIASMGSTGRSTGSHLHLEILRNGDAVDPTLYLSQVE